MFRRVACLPSLSAPHRGPVLRAVLTSLPLGDGGGTFGRTRDRLRVTDVLQSPEPRFKRTGNPNGCFTAE